MHGQWVLFNELPKEAQYALREYFYMAEDDEFQKQMTLRVFMEEWLPLNEAKHRCMVYSPDLKETHGEFETYHLCYAEGDVPDHGESLWHCIVGGMDEWLDDGWHRFHSYVQKGIPLIPTLQLQFKERF